MTFSNASKIKQSYTFVNRRRHKLALSAGEKVIGVYTITCIANMMVYVGCSADLYNRMCVHVAKLRSGKHPRPEMVDDFRTFGEKSFLFEIVATFESFEAALIKETQLIRELTRIGVAYNKAGKWKPEPTKEEIVVESTPCIRRWMDDHGKSAQDLAEVLGIRLSRAKRIMNGLLPCLSELNAVLSWTQGAIKRSDLYRVEHAPQLRIEAAA
jgi:predicted GIY-YIG superfamily endonuclease